MSNELEIQSFADDEVRIWIEQDSSIHLKAVCSHGDPAELTAAEAREIAAALISAAGRLEALDRS